VRERVMNARKIQGERFKDAGIYTNSQMKNRQIKQFCRLDGDSERLLRLATEKYDLSARAYFRLIKVARTIADLEGSEDIGVSHMAEALQYRQVG
jgi:magnesium chelatase family protein